MASLQFDDSREDCLFNERIQKPKFDKANYVVMYEGIEFDLVDFSLSRMRQVMMDCGAACTIERSNDFNRFTDNMVEQLNEDEFRKNKRKLGSAENWLKLKEDI